MLNENALEFEGHLYGWAKIGVQRKKHKPNLILAVYIDFIYL